MACIKDCIVYLALKTMQYKYFDNLQSLLILTHQYKNLSIDFITEFVGKMKIVPSDSVRSTYFAGIADV